MTLTPSTSRSVRREHEFRNLMGSDNPSTFEPVNRRANGCASFRLAASPAACARLAFIAIIGLIAVSGPALAAPAPGEGPDGGDDVGALIDSLGSKDWLRREISQRQLLELGPTVVPPLRQAARSGDLEVSLRARFILSRLDPTRLRYRLLKLRLGSPAAIDEIAEGEGGEGEEVELRNESIRSGDTSGALRFMVKNIAFDDSAPRFEISKRLSSSTFKYPLPAPSGDADAIHLLERGEESFYLQLGTHIESRHRPFVTLFVQDSSRLLDADLQEPPGTGPVLLNARPAELEAVLVEQARRQAGASEPRSRAAAIEILGLLGDRESIGILQALALEPRVRGPALTALARLGDAGARESLEESLRGMPAAGESDSRGAAAVEEDEAALFDAACVLAESGSSIAAGFLVGALGSSGPNVAHRVLSALDAALVRLDGDPPARASLAHQVLERLGEEGALSQFSWNDPATLQFCRRALIAAAPAGATGSTPARRFFESFLSRLRGSDGASRGEVLAFMNLWEIAAGRLEAAALPSADLAAFLAEFRDQSQIEALVVWLFRIHAFEPLPKPFFDALAEKLRARVLEAETGVQGSPLAAVVQLSRQGRFDAEQLRELVRLLLAACGRPHPTHQREVLDELARWLDIDGGPAAAGPGLDPNAKSAPRPGAARPAPRPKPTCEQAAAAAERWLAEPGAAERSLETRRSAAPAAAAGPGSSGERELYEIEVLVRSRSLPKRGRPRPQPAPAPGTGSPEAGAEPGAIEIVDARRVRVAPGVPVAFRDRFGQVHQARLDPVSQQPPDAPPRYRHASGAILTPGLPQFAVPRHRSHSAAWYLDADSQMSPIQLYSSSSPRLKTLLLVADVQGAPDAESDQDPRAIWQRFLGAFRRTLAGVEDENGIRALQSVLVELPLPELTADLREIFRRVPSLTLAQHLLSLDEPLALPYLHERLRSDNAQDQMLAAAALLEAGDRTALPVAIEILRRPNPRVSVYSLLKALEGFIEDAEPTLSERLAILDALLEELHAPAIQARAFAIVQREAGTDFGFLRSQQLSDANERREAQQAAVRDARQWWSGHRSTLMPKDP
jgi:HEAT repeat protein